MKKETRKTLSNLIRLVVGVGLITLLLWRLDFNAILTNIMSVEVSFLLYGIIIYVFFVLISAWRWHVLLRYKRFTMPFMRTLAVYFIATFFNNFLPTTIGGDVMRVLYSMKERRADAVATVLVDRILGFVGLFTFALCAVLFLLLVKKQTEFLPLMIFGLLGIVVLTYLFFSEGVYTRVSPFITRLKVLRIGERLNRLHEATTEFSGAWGLVGICVFQSLVIQGLLALGPFIVMRGMGVSTIDVLPFFIYIPIINVISMIPISFNALGVREYSYSVLFGRVNLPPEISVAISLVSFFLYFIVSLIGGIIFIFYKKE